MKNRSLTMIRKELGLSQQEAADLIEVSLTAWNQWELNQVSMHPAYFELFRKRAGLDDSYRLNSCYTKNDILKNGDFLAEVTHHYEQKNANDGTLKFVDLFCGIGGLRQGFERNGATCIFSSDIDVFAKYTYYTNFNVVPYGDITKIDENKIPDHDILCAGFPCQPFSSIGKREGFTHATQGTMFHEVLRILKFKKPKAILLENVPGIINHDNGNTLNIITNELKKIGYFCHYKIIDSVSFGVPQKRKRFYLVGFLNEFDFHFPVGCFKEGDINIGDYLEKNAEGYSISKHLQGSYLFKIDDGRPNIIDSHTKGAANTLVSSYHKIQRLTGTFVQDGSTGVRLFTEKECKAMMGFPEEFLFPVSRTQMYRQLGNSVVIPVVQEIAKAIITELNIDRPIESISIEHKDEKEIIKEADFVQKDVCMESKKSSKKPYYLFK